MRWVSRPRDLHEKVFQNASAFAAKGERRQESSCAPEDPGVPEDRWGQEHQACPGDRSFQACPEHPGGPGDPA
eukprot:2333920-Rhodomonas_salina.1